MLEYAKNYVKARVKRKLSIALLSALKPLLPALLILVGIGVIAMFVMGVVLYVTPEGNLYAKPTPTEEDVKLQEQYIELADKYNKIDRWVVGGESARDDLWYDKVRSDIDKSDDDYQDYSDTKNWELVDAYGKDKELFETFGQIHAASVFQVLTYRLDMDDITDEFREKVASDFRPYLYYKPSTITVTCTNEEGESSTTRTPIYLLVESNTLSGHRLYHYEWITKHTER